MSKEKTEEIPISEYPVQVSPGRLELVDAYTVYKFQNDMKTDGRWLAVCLCKSIFKKRDNTQGESKSVRIYRWQWRSATRWDADKKKRVPTGEYRWFLEQQHTINKVEIWKSTKDAIEHFIKSL